MGVDKREPWLYMLAKLVVTQSRDISVTCNAIATDHQLNLAQTASRSDDKIHSDTVSNSDILWHMPFGVHSPCQAHLLKAMKHPLVCHRIPRVHRSAH